MSGWCGSLTKSDWGAEAFARNFGEQPAYFPDAPGCWHREEKLLPDTLLDDLRAQGIRHFGIATGRNRFELATVLEKGGLTDQIHADAILTSEIMTKPDGRVLHYVLGKLAALAQADGVPAPGSALFCGDTKDDLDAVLNYRKLAQDGARWVGAVAVVGNGEADFFRRAGSDAVIAHVEQLPAVIHNFNRSGA